MSPGPGGGARQRQRALLRGVVQGVGFRPFAHNLALRLGLTGMVANSAAGVELVVQGGAGAVDEFFARLLAEAPPLARIDEITRLDAPLAQGETAFVIADSRGGRRGALISPDVATCEACLAEMRDPTNRRHGYAFINCTHCGPRYSIIEDLPYDRPQTTMAGFAMCPDCLAEYHDPADRRFHAQPNACPVCGPRLWLADPAGRELAVADPLARAVRALAEGLIVAVKGLGGFHLAANAHDAGAVARLRAGKRRLAKPLALMVADLEAAHGLAWLDAEEARLLASRQRPIVLVRVREGVDLAPGIAPGLKRVGLMLPYTPLHHLIMDRAQSQHGLRALVMTSGNPSDEPICQDAAQAVARLGAGAASGPLCQLMLLHDRPIHLRVDDSVTMVAGGQARLLRRARGYAPMPLLLVEALAPADCPPILAVGAQLKNTICLLRGRQAFVSQHIGELASPEALDFFAATAEHLAAILDAPPAIVARDKHPDYQSSRWADELGLPVCAVQHHHAHAVAVMAEHGLSGPVLALCLDGAGLGDDGTIWGGEMLLGDLADFQRLGRLRPFALAGGDTAARQPWRIGLALLLASLGRLATVALPLELIARHGQRLALIEAMIARGLNAPESSGLGRLFDGVAAICGLCDEVLYEGQAAMELEQAMDGQPSAEAGYAFALTRREGLWELDWRPMIRALAADAAAGAGPALLAGRFHAGLVRALAAWALAGAGEHGLGAVVLGGGCLANGFLLTGLTALLERAGLRVYTPSAMPAGDGGLCLGQAVVAAARWRLGLVEVGAP